MYIQTLLIEGKHIRENINFIVACDTCPVRLWLKPSSRRKLMLNRGESRRLSDTQSSFTWFFSVMPIHMPAPLQSLSTFGSVAYNHDVTSFAVAYEQFSDMENYARQP